MFIFAGVACFFWYLPVYMRQLGLSATESTIIVGFFSCQGTIVRPLVGGLADKLCRHKALMIVCSLVSGMILVFVLLIPQQVPSNKVTAVDVKLMCNHTDSHAETCRQSTCVDVTHSTLFTAALNSCSVTCQIAKQRLVEHVPIIISDQNNSTVRIDEDLFRDIFATDECVAFSTTHAQSSIFGGHELCKASRNISLDCLDEQQDIRFGQTFWILFGLYFIGNIFYCPMFGLLDACIYQLLGDRLSLWGAHRAWGTVGFALFGLSTGFAMELLTEDGQPINYNISYISFLVCHILTALSVGFFKIKRDVRCTSMTHHLGVLIQNIRVVSLIIVLFVYGCFGGLLEGILFWYIQLLGGSSIVLGMMLVSISIPDFIFLLISGRIIALIGDVNCIYIAGLAFIVRFITYGVIRNPWLFLLPELLNGLTWALFFASATVYVAKITPPGMRATMQNMLRSIHFAFGKSLTEQSVSCYNANLTTTSGVTSDTKVDIIRTLGCQPESRLAARMASNHPALVLNDVSWARIDR